MVTEQRTVKDKKKNGKDINRKKKCRREAGIKWLKRREQRSKVRVQTELCVVSIKKYHGKKNNDKIQELQCMNATAECRAHTHGQANRQKYGQIDTQ